MGKQRIRESQTSRVSDNTNTHERVSALEVDVGHLDARLDSINAQMLDGFSSLRRLIESQRQPLTAFAGWASVVLALVYAFVSPMSEKDNRHQDRIDLLMNRELTDAETRGRYQQQFETIKESITGNGNDIRDTNDDLQSLALRFQEHTKDGHPWRVEALVDATNKRIDEAHQPLVERIIALERAEFKDDENQRDIDRK